MEIRGNNIDRLILMFLRIIIVLKIVIENDIIEK